MRAKVTLTFAFLVLTFFVTKAQIFDNFDDGDFTSNPTWSPSGAFDWTINSSLQLQSNNAVANNTFYITTPSTLATTAQWDFYCKIAFNPSSQNYIDVYLTSSSSVLTNANNSGYFIRIGNTNDNICLERKDASGASSIIIDGLHGLLNTSSSVMRIRVIRDVNNNWTLLRDMSGTGSSYTSEGSVIDNTYNTSSFFGILIKQSTPSFFQKHYFDDISVQVYVPDITPPAITSASALSPNTLDIQFNEPVDAVTSQVASNYIANNGIGASSSAVRDNANNALVHLFFANAFPNGPPSVLSINGVQDLSGNAIANGTTSFSFYTPRQYDVVIDEIMASPTPIVGLPNAEWIELKNTSAYNIDLLGWTINKPSSLSGPMPEYVIKPDSFLIVAPSSAVPLLSPFGPTISVTSFPALDNTGSLIYLQSKDGKVVHSVNYTDSWYQNPLKKGGGWSLEMIDTKNPCAGQSNWIASNDPSGGTPGKKNSVDALNPDNTPPSLLKAYATDSVTVTLVFNEPLDSLSALAMNNYTISGGLSIASVSDSSPVFDNVILKLTSRLAPGNSYTATANNVSDCSGNVIGVNNSALFGLASPPDSLDVVINEILFYPQAGGADYVELYNRSQKIIDLHQVYIANRNSAGAVSSIYEAVTDHTLLFPGGFTVLTADTAAVRRQYFTSDYKTFIQMASMPSFPETAGDVIILNQQGNILDEVAYSSAWHFPLLANQQGVSLERIDYNGPSVQQNFHSAASSVGYGTPGVKNSQYATDNSSPSEITVSPDIFSPDNDGHDDYATISYSFPSAGYVTNITIYDASGRPVRYLEKNSLSGIKGYYRWDGLGDKMQKLPIGIYIIVSEVYNTDGSKKLFKNKIVLARRL